MGNMFGGIDGLDILGPFFVAVTHPLARPAREMLDRAYILATTTTREGSATNRVCWPDSAWSFRAELEAWELGGIRW